jgi:hypothetical protein
MIVAQIPPWVFAIFAGLLFLGIRQSRTRLVAPNTSSIVALAMLALSLYGVVAAFGVSALPLAAWALGVSLCAAFGRSLFGPRGLQRAESAVRMPGSWLPLVLMMGIFLAKFVLGFATAVHHPVVAQPWFPVLSSLAFGLLSGAFTARALAVMAFVRSTEAR